MKNFFEKINTFFSDNSPKMKKQDYIIIICIMLIYGIFSFMTLGSNINPQTFAELNTENIAEFELVQNSNVSKIRYYSGERERFIYPFWFK